MEHSGNIPIFNILGIFFWEYSPEFHIELFPNIPGIYHGNVPQIFQEHIFVRWVNYQIEYSMQNLRSLVIDISTYGVLLVPLVTENYQII